MDGKVISSGIRFTTLPRSYVRPESERPRLSEVSACENIPIIDLGCNDRSQAVHQIDDACRFYDFFQVINHGVSTEAVERMQEVGAEFFRLPLEEKMKLYSEDPTKTMRLSTSYNVRKEEVHNSIDDIGLRCHPLDKDMEEGPSKPPIFSNNIEMDVIRSEELDLRLTLGNNYEEKANAFVSTRMEGGPMKDATGMAIVDGKAIVDNPNYAHLSGATSQTNTTEPNDHPASKSNSNLGGNAKKQRASGNEELEMASEPGPKKYLLSNQSLLSTKKFDGALVKYTLKSRNITLPGMIKGSKILCCCNECNKSKAFSPTKFELHAGGKTKRPYSHIFLKNGMTINQVLKKLRALPKDMRFHRLEEIARSAFDGPSFNNQESRPDPSVLASPKCLPVRTSRS